MICPEKPMLLSYCFFLIWHNWNGAGPRAAWGYAYEWDFNSMAQCNFLLLQFQNLQFEKYNFDSFFMETYMTPVSYTHLTLPTIYSV